MYPFTRQTTNSKLWFTHFHRLYPKSNKKVFQASRKQTLRPSKSLITNYILFLYYNLYSVRWKLLWWRSQLYKILTIYNQSNKKSYKSNCVSCLFNRTLPRPGLYVRCLFCICKFNVRMSWTVRQRLRNSVYNVTNTYDHRFNLKKYTRDLSISHESRNKMRE